MRTLLFLLISSCLSAHSSTNIRQNYQYYYNEPFFASMTAVLMLPTQVQPTTITMDPIEGRSDIFLLEDHAKINIHAYIQDHSAPLVYVLPGLGGGTNNGSAMFIGEKLFLSGYSVIIIPSPFNWQFILSQSQSGLPGISERDSVDLINFMSKVKFKLEKEHNLNATHSSIVGFSMGAHYAAFIMKQERVRSVLNISKVVLINPPLDLKYATGVLDSLYETGANWNDDYKDQIWGYLINKGFELLSMMPANTNSIPFEGWDKVFRLTTGQIKYIIGDTFRNTLREVIFTSHQIKDFGLLNQPVGRFTRNARFDEAKTFSYQRYLSFVASSARDGEQSNKYSERFIIQMSNLNSLSDMLASDSAFRMMHNLDDFLIKQEDLLRLSTKMKSRAILYPKGGHVGNLWYDENFKDILHLLEN